MATLLLAILLEANAKFLCVVFVVASFVAVGLCRRPNRACPRCHTINRPPARYCAHCGARLNRP